MFAVQLFDRSPKGVEPTMYGRALLKRSRAAFDELKQGIRDIDFLADPTTGEIRLGCPATIIATILLPIIQSFSQQYPRVNLYVEDSVSFAHEISELRDRKYDFVLGRLVNPHGPLGDDLMTEFLFDDPLVVAAGMQTRWARRRKVDLAELIDEPWVLPPPGSWMNSFVAEAFWARGLGMPRVKVASYSAGLTQLLATGKFIGVTSGFALRLLGKQLGIKALPIDLPVWPFPVAIVMLKNRTVSPVVELFVKHARGFVASAGGEP